MDPFGSLDPFEFMGGGAPAFSELTLSPFAWWSARYGLFQERTGASATTPASADNDLIGTILDQSGNSHHLTATNDSKRPTLKTGIQNGKSVSRYDGSNDALVSDSIAHGIGTGDYLLAMVIRTGASVDGYQTILNAGSNAPALYIHNGFVDLFHGGDFEFHDTQLATSTAYLIMLWRDAGTLKCSINGVQQATTFSYGASLPTATLTIGEDGGSLPLHMDLAEFLLASSFALKADLETYWNSRPAATRQPRCSP